jgi:integrase/recombinase XerD
LVRATRAENDKQLLQSWLKSLSSPHTRRNFETTARRVLAELPMGLRDATVEDVRTALENVTQSVGKATRQQYILRTKSMLGYAHKVGYTPFNAGAVIKIKPHSPPWRYWRPLDRVRANRPSLLPTEAHA